MRNIYLINKERSGKTYRTKINDASTDNSPAKVTGTITEEIGSIGSIEMYVYANNPGYNVIKPYSSRILATDQQGNPIFFGRVLRVTPEFSASGFGRKVICESMIGFLHDQPVPIQVFNDTIPNILNKVLGLYNKTHSDVWKFDASGIDGELLAEKHEIQSEGESLYEFISNKLFSALGLEMRVWVDGGVVANDYYQTMYIGAYVTATSVSDAITIGDNLISYQCDEDATNLCTKIVPYGSKLYTDEDNLERVTVAEVNGGDITVVGDTSVYDVCKTVIFDDIETAQELLDAAEDYLLENEEPQRTYQITAFDKHLLDPTFPAIVLGNYYMVNAPLLNINKMYLRITKRTLGIESPSNDTFTVGSACDATSSGQIAASAADVQSLTNYTSSLEKYSTKQIRALYGEFDTLHANAVTTDTLVSKVASISTLKADDAIIKNIQTEALTTDAIKAALADINVLTAEQADIRYLTVAKANALYLTAEQADVKYLTVENAKVTYLSTEVAKATYLTAETANILYLTTDRADVRYLTTDKADIKYADITLANVKAGAIGTALIATGAIGTAQIADGSITSAKIVELTADKITAGTLSVERLCLVGSDKSVIYALNNVGDLVSKNVDSLDATILTKRSITADCIVAGAITSKEIAAETITTNLLAANAVTADKVDITSLIASDAFISNLGATKIIVGMQSDISTAQSTANSATSAAGTAQTTANNAASAAKTAQTTADNAASAAKTAQSTANTASSTASAASTAASSATETANAANKAAASATETANSAKKTADGASSTASTAKTTADSAVSTASAAKTTADSAASTANTAKTTANSASGTANSALSELRGLYSANTTTIDGGKITTGSIKAAQIDVDNLMSSTAFISNLGATKIIVGMQSDISTAQSTANSATSAAGTAQTTANNAASAAKTAQTTADNAASAAKTAQSTANTAKTTANSASGTANSALSELHGLYSANTTTIDGGKITTGSIKAAQINVSDLFAQAITATGSISGATITTNSGKIAGWALSSLGLKAGLTAISDTKNTGIMLSPSLGIRLNNIDNGGVFIQNNANSRINTCTIRGNYLDFSNTATAGDKAILGCYNSIYPMLSFTNSANTIETKITGTSASFGGTVDFSGSLYLGNNRGIYAKDTSNTNRQMMIYNGGHNLLIGYGAKEKKAGMTTVYGNTVRMFAVTNAIFASDASNGYLYPSITGKHRLGTSTYKWQYVYATNGTIQTSDLRQKDNVQAIDERYERLYMLMQPVTYRWRNVNPDDNHDRTRIGFIAQWTKTAMDEAGLNAVDLAAYCKDPVYPTVHTSDGTEIEDTSATPIDYLYGLNYGEFIALNTHMVQKLYAKLGDLVNKQIIPMQARIAYLENQINNKTQSIA
nr:MAG TPA: endosialidase chaperone [Caudoviricetes sp.]